MLGGDGGYGSGTKKVFVGGIRGRRSNTTGSGPRPVGAMTGLPCEACGQPRGRGVRCKECGYDRYATKLESTRVAEPAVTPHQAAPQPAGRPTATSTPTGEAQSPAQPQPRSPTTERAGTRPAAREPARERARTQPAAGPRTPFAQPRPPVATGRVISLNTTAPARGDRPWWVSLVYVLALLPALMAVAVVIAIRAFAKTLRSSTGSVSRSPFKLPALAPKPHWSPSPALTFGAVGALLGYRAGRASASTECSQMRVRSTGGETECRYLAAPASIPVAQGDELNLWG